MTWDVLDLVCHQEISDILKPEKTKLTLWFWKNITSSVLAADDMFEDPEQ